MKNIQEIKGKLKTKTKSLIVKVNGNRKEVECFYLPEFPVCHRLGTSVSINTTEIYFLFICLHPTNSGCYKHNNCYKHTSSFLKY